ncbi:hypothetical protein UlMin_030968 [Ulmus minor]
MRDLVSKILNQSRFLLFFMIFTLFLETATSEDYIVGDDQEWSSGNNYQSWSEKYNFSVGDVLVFNYVKGQHNAYEVVEKVYRSCDASSGVLAKYEGGNDRVELTEAKKYWFICDIKGHCLGGMKFSVDVKHASPSSNNTDSPDGSPSSQPTLNPVIPPSSSCRGSLLIENLRIGIFVIAFGMLSNMFC